METNTNRNEDEMKTLSFYGSSDDNFCYDVNGMGCDEKGCYNRHEVWTISSKEGSVQVVGWYAPKDTNGGCWMIGLMQWDDGDKLPNWNYRYRFDEYTVILDMDVPDDAVVS